MKEKDLEKYLVKRVRALGGECRKVVFPGHRGAPDRLILFPNGRALWVELKTISGIVSAVQMREHNLLSQLRQSVRVLRTVESIDDVISTWIQGWPL